MQEALRPITTYQSYLCEPIIIHLSQHIESHMWTNQGTLKFCSRRWALANIYCVVCCSGCSNGYVTQLTGKYVWFWFDVLEWGSMLCTKLHLHLLCRMNSEIHMKSRKCSLKVCRTSRNCDCVIVFVLFLVMLGGSLVTWNGASSGCRWRRHPPGMEGSCEYTE
jgi:hypothetical protein